MELAILVITSLILIAVITFIGIYLNNERKRKAKREIELTEQKKHFDILSKEFSSAQLKTNQIMNSGLEKFQNESINVKKEVADKFSELKSALKEYTELINTNLTQYSKANSEFKTQYLKDNSEFHKSMEQAEKRIQKELQNLMDEIKSPLDLD
jgi:uncharacterized protein YpmS